MSTVIIDEITTDIRDRKTVQKRVAPKSRTFLDRLNIKGKYENHKLAKVWAWRNYDHGEVFANSLEVEHINFDQNIFIEETPDLCAKLSRIGFVEQVGFPDEELFKSFSRVMYHKKHNIAITLYQSKYKNAIDTAHKIMLKTETTGETANAVFVSAVEVLINK